MSDSPAPSCGYSDAVVRPSRNHFNRPARSLVDLMRVPPADFPFVASWTILGCAPTPCIIASGRALEGGETARLGWLDELREGSNQTGAALPPLPTDIAMRLAEYRLYRSGWTGARLVRLRRELRTRGWLRPVDSVLRKLPGLVRYTYRHCRKWLHKGTAHLLGRLHRRQNQVILDDLTPQEREMFDRLAAARAAQLGH